jgi:hypothetical protein
VIVEHVDWIKSKSAAIWAAFKLAVSDRDWDVTPTTKLWLLIQVAIASTARGMKAVNKTTTPNCSLMPIRILISPPRRRSLVQVHQYVLLLDACVAGIPSPPFAQPLSLGVPCNVMGVKYSYRTGPIFQELGREFRDIRLELVSKKVVDLTIARGCKRELRVCERGLSVR